MKLIEHNSNQLIFKDSTVGSWMIRLVCTPFLILAVLGFFLVITEKVFPSFFIIFCLVVGIFGVFWTSTQTVYLNKSQNKLRIETQRLLGTKRLEYPLDNLNVRVEKTSFRVKTYSSLLKSQKEPIYIVVLEIASNAQTINISSNYSLTRNQAVEIADLIRTFLNTPP
ncbi:hypothetical protein [Planktothrix pseudagardhii]|uniref:Uncharacterized protein n=1 Tax=Planktothrix pseudagardhii TaxID=132604 RepID=A0A9W4G6V8_9CYAN|nr:hypothetical protein [Planktothrix pseudagardhii]CAD5961528.1 hypothetical protein NO713_03230 [Planktothrix pseudagardhii]